MENLNLLFLLTLGGTGLFLLLFDLCFYYYFAVIKKKRCSTRTEGTVIGRSFGGSGNVPSPIVEYRVDGRVYKRRNPFVKGTRVQYGRTVKYNMGYEVGDSVDVYYDPDKPKRWIMNDGRGYKTTALIFIIFGGVLLAAGIALFIFV